LAIIDEEFTVKRLHKRNGIVRLLSENSAYEPIEFKDGQELRIWGVVTCGLRKLLNA
jgi:DNA polymerase V